jgi:hypothetical protein
VQECSSTGAKTGSALWVGTGCNVSVSDSDLTGNESYAVESNNAKAIVEVTNCKMSGNRKGEQDEYNGGKVRVTGEVAA